MGIHGIFKEIGPGHRISLAKLAADHYIAHSRPFRLAIDISIWLFQIQSGKGGSNPALRTFYYRLLRLLTLNIHPLFVFDGPNKPLFKRNKKVGGPGVRVASVPEFLAKQLLKQFGFPWHVAPGEAEAECALLQREGVVDGVMSEDVDTLMFGSGVTLKNWTSENSTKSPTHVNVYRAEATKSKSGLDCAGMILVALMSGGDYLPEGIPGCGPKVACDAARAGFGKELCALGKKDTAGLRLWKDRLQHQIRTNEAKYFSRRNTGFTMPEDFPNFEVLGYYTHPCVSTPDKLQRLREGLQWDRAIDFPALRTFTSDAFDWRCVGGAKKFIRNLAPAMLVQELRLRGEGSEPAAAAGEGSSQDAAQEEREKALVLAVHGKRHHSTTDNELEYRISFTPAHLVPIDLSLEDEDDEFLPAGGGGGADDSEAESEFATLPPSSTAAEGAESDAPAGPSSPTKRKPRQPKPFDPTQPEKVWLLRTFLQVGCPLVVEEYEASFRDPKEFLRARRLAREVTTTAGGGAGNIHAAVKGKKGAGRKKPAGSDMPTNALMAYAKVTKGGTSVAAAAAAAAGGTRQPLKETQPSSQGHSQSKVTDLDFDDKQLKAVVSGFRLPASQVPKCLLDKYVPAPQQRARSAGSGGDEHEVVDLVDLDETPRPFARFAAGKAGKAGVGGKAKAKEKAIDIMTLANKPKKPAVSKAKPVARPMPTQSMQPDVEQMPPRRKRRSPELSSPAMSQRTIPSYYSPSPRKPLRSWDEQHADIDFINLVSSSPAKAMPPLDRPLTPTPPNIRHTFIRSPEPEGRRVGGLLLDFSPGKLPDTVTKRRKKGGPLRRHRTAPALGAGDYGMLLPTPGSREGTPVGVEKLEREGEGAAVEAMGLAGPSLGRCGGGGGFLVCDDNDGDGDDDDGLASPSRFLGKPAGRLSGGKAAVAQAVPPRGNAAVGEQEPPASSYPTPPLAHEDKDADADEDEEEQLPAITPPPPALPTKKKPNPKPKPAAVASKPKPVTSKAKQAAAPSQQQQQQQQPTRRSPRQETRRKAIQLRQSLEGAWKEVDLTDDGSGWKQSNGRAAIGGWRRSGVEVLDLTGA
ncbi:hypothetical protein LTR36_007197 [Oleoguttula mirabilis]|uniref:XPG-I domain-containing protein n=1 Tax=Oleoguttula mirabilis TaxID=1507867 RepID=A0AAV9JA66_9PEZI|nr:hypothetical protein LTR36_007197 [Oleoguttula mirabilis]